MNNYNYGFIFNSIEIKGDKFVKKGKNNYGIKKINLEIQFYKFIQKNKISFNIPALIDSKDGELVIEFKKYFTILTEKISSKNCRVFIDLISKEIKTLHDIKKDILFEKILTDIKLETLEKPLKRYNEFNWKNCSILNSIKTVNGFKFKTVEFYSDTIYKKILRYLKNRNYYNLIHGDIHLGNILVNKENEIFFIDPRGYFGESLLFGLKEYDFAKLLFGLSGYSYFDTKDVKSLDIEEGNLNISFIKKGEIFFEDDTFDSITKLLALSIWLSNNNCFVETNKKIMSLMTSYYLCEKYLDRI